MHKYSQSQVPADDHLKSCTNLIFEVPCVAFQGSLFGHQQSTYNSQTMQIPYLLGPQQFSCFYPEQSIEYLPELMHDPWYVYT
jgi:hypothetical protein